MRAKIAAARVCGSARVDSNKELSILPDTLEVFPSAALLKG